MRHVVTKGLILHSRYCHDTFMIFNSFFSRFQLQRSNEHRCSTDQYWLMHILAVTKDFLQLRPIFKKKGKVLRINSTVFNSERLEC